MRWQWKWQCYLYGHQWRHPGEYEVVLAESTDPAYPFQCALCGRETLVDGKGVRRSDVRDLPPAERERELEPPTGRDVLDE